MRNQIGKYFVGAVLFTLAFAFGAFDSGASTFITANVVGVVASGVGVATSFNAFNTVPQFLYFEIATTPQNLKVNVSGDTLICDLDTAGLNAIKNQRVLGSATNGFLIPLANGLITGKNIDITVVNNVAATFSVFAFSFQSAPVDAPGYYISLGVNVNAGATADIVNWKYLAIPSFSALDILNTYGNKRTSKGMDTGADWSGKMELEDVRGSLGWYENNTGNKVAIDNFNGQFNRALFTPNAAQKIYIQRLVPVGANATIVV